MEKIKLNIQMFAGATIDGYSTASNCDCQIVWSSTLDPDKNTSSVTASIQIRKNGSGSTQGTFSGNITIDGTSQGVSKYDSWSWGTWHTVGSYTKTITHNDNGQKTITISGSLTQTGTSMAGTYSASGTATLDTNNRASVLGDIDNFGINDTVDIPITKYVAGYTDSLVISSGATTIRTVNSITNGYSLTFTTAQKNAILALMTSPKISLTFTLTTKDGATQIGANSVKTVTVSSLDKPVLYDIKKKANGHYKVAINGLVDDNVDSPLQVYNDNGNDVLGRNIITAKLNGNISGTSNSQYFNRTIELIEKIKVGSKLSMSGGGIKIGNGVTKVLVSAIMGHTAADTNSDIMIFKNSLSVAYSCSAPYGYYRHNVQPPFIVNVEENDIIYLKNYCNDNNKAYFIMGDTTEQLRTYMTVEVIE